MFYDMEFCLGALIFKMNFMAYFIKNEFCEEVCFIKLNFMKASVLPNRIFEGGPK